MTRNEYSEFIEVFRPRLLRSVIHRWGEDGEDFLQEALLRTWNTVDKFNHSCTIETWVYSYVRIIAADYYRKNPPIEMPQSDEPEDIDESVRQVVEATKKLPKKQKESILTFLEGDVKHSKKTFYIARNKLKEYFR